MFKVGVAELSLSSSKLVSCVWRKHHRDISGLGVGIQQMGKKVNQKLPER